LGTRFNPLSVEGLRKPGGLPTKAVPGLAESLRIFIIIIIGVPGPSAGSSGLIS
jgi:hypothetical protein